MRQVYRPEPMLPAQAMKTYQIVAPRSSHFRPASCEESNCGAYGRGWKTLVDETMELGQGQAAYIRKNSGRKFRDEKTPEGLTAFIFEPGQECFQSSQHVVSLEREPFYFVKDGDFRGNPRGTEPRQHTQAEDWVEDFAEHQDSIAREIEKG